METLFNGRLSIEVSAHGAELCSIFSNGKEYLWQADPAFWKRHSPVLFPIVGSVWENEYRNEDTTYVLTQHGFARDMEFTLISEENDEVRYQLVSNEETLKKYPFPFRLTIGYRIREKKVDVMWEVENTGEKEMHFQIGAHPAFYYPDFDAETQERGFFGFNKKSGLKYILISEKGCADPDTQYPLMRLLSDCGRHLPRMPRLSVLNHGTVVATKHIIQESIKIRIGYSICNPKRYSKENIPLK